jgi:hypothetical protein
MSIGKKIYTCQVRASDSTSILKLESWKVTPLLFPSTGVGGKNDGGVQLNAPTRLDSTIIYLSGEGT